MKENLELAEHVPVTEFSFSINEPYEKEVIGKGPYRTSSLYKLVPNFIGNTEAQARAKASKLGLRVTFTGDSSGTVVSQSYPEAKRIDLIKGNIVLTLSNGKNNTSKDDNTTVKNNDKDKDKDKDKDTDKDKDNNKPATGGDSNTGSGTTPGSDSGSGSGSNPGSTGEPNDKKIDNDD